MSDASVIDLVRETVVVILLVSAPVLIISMLVGLVISIIQTTTSIQEQTLTFVPKLIVSLLVLVYFGYFIVGKLMNYTLELFSRISSL